MLQFLDTEVNCDSTYIKCLIIQTLIDAFKSINSSKQLINGLLNFFKVVYVWFNLILKVCSNFSCEFADSAHHKNYETDFDEKKRPIITVSVTI